MKREKQTGITKHMEELLEYKRVMKLCPHSKANTYVPLIEGLHQTGKN